MSKRSIYSHDYETLLEMLRKARDDAGVSQIDLAKRLSITQSAVSKFERGDRRLDVVQLRDWCKALKVSFSDFMTQFDRKL